MPKNPHADFSPVLEGYSGQSPFRYWCQMALPLTYDDSLSYYELLNKVVTYVNNTIEDVANAETNISRLSEAYDNLQKYVNDYFDDIDIEAELRNVLDKMALDGSFDVILNPLIAQQLPAIVADQIVDVVAAQISAVVAAQIDGVVGEQLPTVAAQSIPSVVTGWLNDNVTPVGSAVVVDDSLSISGAAADAKTTGDNIDEIYENLDIVIDDIVVNFGSLTEYSGVVKDDGTWNSSSSYKGYYVYCYNYKKVKIESNSSYNTMFAFIKNSNMTNGETVPFCDGETSRRTLISGSTEIYDIPNDCQYIWVYKSGNGHTYTPSLMEVKGEVCRANKIIGNIDLVPILRNESTITDNIINSSGGITTGTTRKTYELENKNYTAITIDANYRVAYVSFVTSSIEGLTGSDDAPICYGCEARYSIPANTTKTFLIPNDCAYIEIMYRYENDYFTPKGGFIYGENSVITAIPKAYMEGLPRSISKEQVTACIIGASIEAGRTHNRITGAAENADPEKAYLTVALRNNGVRETNYSKGGMGWGRASSVAIPDTSPEQFYTCKYIVDYILAHEGFTAYDSLYFCLGANDWNHNYPLGDSEASDTGDNDVCGQMKYAFEQVYANNPAIKIFVKNMDGWGSATGHLYSQHDLEIQMERVCEKYGVEIIKLGNMRNIYNKDITTDYYPRTIFPDGTHPCKEVMALMAKRATGQITFK